MKTKLLCHLKYLVAACVLALGTGTTKASTVYADGVVLTPQPPPINYCGSIECIWLSQPFTVSAGYTVFWRGDGLYHPLFQSLSLL
jgi:hypothetical protein